MRGPRKATCGGSAQEEGEEGCFCEAQGGASHALPREEAYDLDMLHQLQVSVAHELVQDGGPIEAFICFTQFKSLLDDYICGPR